MSSKIEEGNLFMMCEKPSPDAFASLPDGFLIRNLHRDELAIWKTMQFDDSESAREYRPVMDSYYQNVYARDEALFYQRCLLVCDAKTGQPVGTCFVWPAYGCIDTVHWLKVVRGYEGRGIGRALLSAALRQAPNPDEPIFLHTHPACLRAIKLYVDFGFALLTDPRFGARTNDLQRALPYLKASLPANTFEKLRYAKAPDAFMCAVNSTEIEEF